MKNIFIRSLQQGNTDVALLFVRVSIAALMLTHGVPKMAMLFSDEPIVFASVFGMSQSLALALTVFAEVFCSLLILVGFGTRLFTIPLIVTMATAAFYFYGADSFSKKELPLLYLIGLLTILIVGAGKYSLDALVVKRHKILAR